MRPSRSFFRLLIAAITLACAGLIWLQVRFLLNTAELKRATFDESVRTAMARTAAAITELSVMDRIFLVESDQSRRAMTVMPRWKLQRKDSTVHMSVIAGSEGIVRSRITDGQLSYDSDRPQRLIVQTFTLTGSLDSTLLDRSDVVGEHTLPLPVDKMHGKPFIIRMQTDAGSSTVRVDPEGLATGFVFSTGDTTKRERVVRQVLESFEAKVSDEPRFRVSPDVLDSLVTSHLQQQSIDIPFTAALVKGDSVVVAGTGAERRSLAESAFRIPVGHFTPFNRSEDLVLDFPTVGSYLVSQLMGELGLSVALVGIIIACFVYSVRTLLRQQEFAKRLIDFINNMTHEFKTPVSTVSLASEALDRSDVLRSATKVRRYNAVIRDENKRMRSQIDRILQMASLEEGDIEFRRETVSMHHVVQSVVAAMEVQISSRNGSLDTGLSAKKDLIVGDRVHLENVIHNVLENAVKYSPDRPIISVRSADDGNAFEVTVSDKGIGIDPAYVGKVFDKYFRVPTGNVHDVKGFGLGLSYVKLVIEKHGGSVSIDSSPGKGTAVNLRLPLS